MKKDLATTLYTIFGGSMESSLNLLGMDVNDEKEKRIRENEQNFDTKVFYPRASTYTTSSSDSDEIDNKVDNKGGRPANSKMKRNKVMTKNEVRQNDKRCYY